MGLDWTPQLRSCADWLGIILKLHMLEAKLGKCHQHRPFWPILARSNSLPGPGNRVAEPR